MNTNTDPALDELDQTSPTELDTDNAPTPISKRADEWQEKTDRAVENALLGDTPIIAGRTMKKLTGARGSILRRCSPEFIQGAKMSELADPLLAVGKFIYVMTGDLREVLAVSKDPDRLEEEAMLLLDDIELRSVKEVVLSINSFVRSELEGQVYGEPQKSDDGSPVDTSGPKN